MPLWETAPRVEYGVFLSHAKAPYLYMALSVLTLRALSASRTNPSIGLKLKANRLVNFCTTYLTGASNGGAKS